jgi:transcriptional regulator with XRE-family HTH domain
VRARHGYPRPVASDDVSPVEDAGDCGRTVRELRCLKNISVAELAARAGVSEADVAEFEAGNVVPARPAFIAYLRVLGYA